MYVYIIQRIINHSFYTGMTSDIEKRILEHNSGRESYLRANRAYQKTIITRKNIYNESWKD
jgi:predicted GIY-YIG superfamily endonuclease